MHSTRPKTSILKNETTYSQFQNTISQSQVGKEARHPPMKSVQIEKPIQSHNKLQSHLDFKPEDSLKAQSVTIGRAPNSKNQYVSKLESHIDYLKGEVNKEKDKASNYKENMLQLMQKDANPVVDHAIQTENKYKDMKLNIVSKINELMKIYVGLMEEIEGLRHQKMKAADKLTELIGQSDQQSDKQENEMKMLKEKYKESKQLREQFYEDLNKAQNEKNRQTKELQQLQRDQLLKQAQQLREDQRWYEEYGDPEANQGFDLALIGNGDEASVEPGCVIKDLRDKEKQRDKLKKQFEEQNNEKEEDADYKKFNEDIKAHQSDLEQIQAQLAENLYHEEELKQLIKYSNNQKEEEFEERKNLKEELIKYQKEVENKKIQIND